jgi:hypothetical protein
MLRILAATTLLVCSPAALAEAPSPAAPLAAAANQPIPGPKPGSFLMPAGTMLVVTPAQEISSKRVEEGQRVLFRVVNDVVEAGRVVIRRGSPVYATVTWKTGRAIGGKSGKFELRFDSVKVDGRDYSLTGQFRQEGRGNTVGALLGSMWISGRSAVMMPGDMVNVFTNEPVIYW